MDELLGAVKLIAGNFCPHDYMYCDGQILQISQYQALYALIGNQYGGDKIHTFALPNLNKTPVIQGTTLKYIICTQGIFPSRPD
jgi:microcystin-dependent protein